MLRAPLGYVIDYVNHIKNRDLKYKGFIVDTVIVITILLATVCFIWSLCNFLFSGNFIGHSPNKSPVDTNFVSVFKGYDKVWPFLYTINSIAAVIMVFYGIKKNTKSLGQMLFIKWAVSLLYLGGGFALLFIISNLGSVFKIIIAIVVGLVVLLSMPTKADQAQEVENLRRQASQARKDASVNIFEFDKKLNREKARKLSEEADALEKDLKR